MEDLNQNVNGGASQGFGLWQMLVLIIQSESELLCSTAKHVLFCDRNYPEFSWMSADNNVYNVVIHVILKVKYFRDPDVITFDTLVKVIKKV